MTNLITDNKKVQYLYNSLLTQNIKDNYPGWGKLIKGYFEFLDQSYSSKILNITENCNAQKVYSEFLDDLLDNDFKNVIDPSRYILTDSTKRLLLSLSKMINNLKGNRKAFDFFFKTLSNFVINNDGEDIEEEKISIGYYENEDWWNPPVVDYHNGLIKYDGSADYKSYGQYKPYSYQFEIDQSQAAIADLIRQVHPAGFHFEFVTRMVFEDTVTIEEEAETNTTYFFFYNQDNTPWRYDGVPFYSGSKTYNDLF